jgi:hypothetical protein
MKKLHLAILSFLASLSFILLTAPSYPALSQETDLHPVYLPLIARDYDPTWVWGEPELVTISPYPRNILMATDNHGRQHLFWDVSTGERFIYHSYQTVEGWTEPIKIAETLGMSELIIQPLVTPDGKIHLLWHNSLAFGGPYRLIYSSFDGREWFPEQEIVRYQNRIPYARLNYHDSGDIHIAYTLSAVFINYYHRILTSSGWTDPEKVSPYSVYPTILWKSYVPDRHGGLRFYGSGVDNHLYYAYWIDGEFLIPRQLFQGDITSWSGTLIDRNDALHIFRTSSVPIPGGSVTGLYHRCIDQNLTVLPEQVLSGNEQIGAYKGAWDSANRLAFAWKGSTTPLFKLVLIDDCTVIDEKQGDFSALGSYSFRYLTVLSLNTDAGKFCALVDIAYQSTTYGLVCADVRR